MAATKGRPVRPGEIPRFGSVWYWFQPDATWLMALGLQPRRDRMNLSAIVVRAQASPMIGELDESYVWSDHSGVLDKWICIDEGPDL